MLKYLLVLALAIVVLACAFSSPISAYCLAVWVNVDENGNLQVHPEIFVNQIPRASMLRGYSVSKVATPRYSWSLNISQIFLQVNVTAKNTNETTFFYGSFTFDTLAEQKITLYREYNATLRTQEFTLYIDARLTVQFSDATLPIEREFHGQYGLKFPA